MGLPEKKNCFKFTESVFLFFCIFVFFIILCSQINSVSAVSNEAIQGKGNVSITEFFSDHNLSDATVRFEQPLENVSLVFTLSLENKGFRSKTFPFGHVEKGQEITKVLFWGLEEDFRQDRESYTAQLFVMSGDEILDSRNLSFPYRSPILSKLKLIDFSADSEKASVLITLTSSTNLRSMQIPEPSVIDLDLKLLSGTDVVYSESQENIPVTDAYYKPIYWPILLEKGRNYTALLKVHSHSPYITTAYRSDFRAEEKVEFVDKDVRVDEYGASVTVIGKSQVPFDGVIRVVLTPKEGEVRVFEETADILTAGKEDTLGIVWQGIPKGDYNVKIYAVDLKGKILDIYETALRVLEPAAEATPVEKSPAFDFLTALGVFLSLGIFLFLGVFPGRKKE